MPTLTITFTWTANDDVHLQLPVLHWQIISAYKLHTEAIHTKWLWHVYMYFVLAWCRFHTILYPSAISSMFATSIFHNIFYFVCALRDITSVVGFFLRHSNACNDQWVCVWIFQCIAIDCAKILAYNYLFNLSIHLYERKRRTQNKTVKKMKEQKPTTTKTRNRIDGKIATQPRSIWRKCNGMIEPWSV